MFGISAWISQCLIHGRYSIQLEMNLVSVGHETETLKFSFAQGTSMSLELWLLLPDVIVRWIYQDFREQD